MIRLPAGAALLPLALPLMASPLVDPRADIPAADSHEMATLEKTR